MFGLSFIPLDLGVLREAPAFRSKDARLVRASLLMLEAAWRSPRPGSIPSDVPYLSELVGLSLEETARAWQELTHGWEVGEDGRLHHRDMEVLAERMVEQFGPQLSVLASSFVVAAHGSDNFNLLPSEAVAKESKRRKNTLYPRGFEPDTVTQARLREMGYVGEDLVWVLSKFQDFACRGEVKYKDWQAALRNFAGSSITLRDFQAQHSRRPGELQRVAPGGGPVSLRDRVLASRHERNRAMVSNVINRAAASVAMASEVPNG